MKNIGLISCGRSDFNIYLPLMKKLEANSQVNFKIIAAGTHPLAEYGNTINLFEQNGLTVTHVVDVDMSTDDEHSINRQVADTITEFSKIWSNDDFDLVFVLGDRYEMFAAASSTVPFNIPLAHLHGGETTLGAIDNVYRDAITSMSKYHFTTTDRHMMRVMDIKGTSDHVYNVGSLALEYVAESNFEIDQTDSILFCYHPETVDLNNKNNIQIICDVLNSISNPVTVLLPNNDTNNQVVRDTILEQLTSERFKIERALGTNAYYMALANCKFMLGNSSSGIIESGLFKKYAINLGDRQKGRECGGNVVHCPIDKNSILKTISKVNKQGLWEHGSPFYKPDSSNYIINTVLNGK